MWIGNGRKDEFRKEKRKDRRNIKRKVSEKRKEKRNNEIEMEELRKEKKERSRKLGNKGNGDMLIEDVDNRMKSS